MIGFPTARLLCMRLGPVNPAQPSLPAYCETGRPALRADMWSSQAEVVFPGVVYRPIREEDAWVQVELLGCPEAEDPAVGRFVAFMRDEARSRRLFRAGFFGV